MRVNEEDIQTVSREMEAWHSGAAVDLRRSPTSPSTGSRATALETREI